MIDIDPDYVSWHDDMQGAIEKVLHQMAVAD